MIETHDHKTEPKKRFKLLIVDDDPVITSTFKKGLEANGFSVDSYNDPINALSNFIAGIYNIVLLDIKMPRMNGFELYREIEKFDDKVKVCFITSFVPYYESLTKQFPSLHIHCFIKKPIGINTLVARLKAELDK